MNIKNKIGFYSVKIISIFIISIIYFITGATISLLINDFLPGEKEIKNSSTLYLFFLACIIFGFIGIFYYFLRINIKYIPFPLDGLFGFKYTMLKEASGGIIIAFITYNYLVNLKLLLSELKSRIDKT